MVLVTMDESAKGIKALEEARKGGEKSTWLHESPGWAYLQSGKPKDAAKSLEEANRKADAATRRKKAGLQYPVYLFLREPYRFRTRSIP